MINYKGISIPDWIVDQFNLFANNAEMFTGFTQAGRAHDAIGLSQPLLMAHASRETNMRNIKGDQKNGKFHGFGIMQVDIGTDEAFCRAWTPANIVGSIKRGAEIWESKHRYIIENQGSALSVKGHQFIGRAVQFDDARRVATAAYNVGLWAYYCFSKNKHVDSFTTGKNYSRDVYDRAVYFACLLERSGMLANALRNEVMLQGKYARDQHQIAAGFNPTGDEPEQIPEAAPLPATVPPVIEASPNQPTAPPEVGNWPISHPEAKDVEFVDLAPVPAAAPVVTVEAAKPVTAASPERSAPGWLQEWLNVFHQVKHSVIAIITGATGLSWAWLKHVDLNIVIGATCGTLAVYFLLSKYYRDKREARELEANLERERRAHEITLATINAAARRDLQTVRVRP